MYRFFEMSVLINLRRKRKIFFLPFTSRNVLFIYYYARRNKKIHRAPVDTQFQSIETEIPSNRYSNRLEIDVQTTRDETRV